MLCPFQSGKKTNADGSGTYDFTSLMWSDKRKLLQQLPQKLEVNLDAIEQCIGSSVIKLWDVSLNLTVSILIKNEMP